MCQKLCGGKRCIAQWLPEVEVIKYLEVRPWDRCSSLVRHFIAHPERAIPALEGRSGPFGGFALNRRGSNQNNIRSASGTPLDSGRFRPCSPRDLERNEVLTNIVVSDCQNLYAVCHFRLSSSRCFCRSGRAIYAARNFAINTDINKLISPDLDWRKRDNQFEQAFDREKLILAVVEAPTPELASAAAQGADRKARRRHRRISSRSQPLGSGEFFEKNGLLFLPTEEVGKVAGQLEAAAPLIEIMAGDPSIRGLTGALETGLAGVKRGQVKLDNAERPFNLISRDRRGRPRTRARDVLLARTRQRQAADRCRPARLHRVQADARLSARWNPARMPPTRSGRPRPTSISPAEYQRARAADRPGSDRQRGICDRAGRRDRQRHRHRPHRAGDPLDGAAFRARSSSRCS